MKKTTRETATQTYETRQREIATMIEYLQAELEVHAETAKSDGLNWCHVGDLAQIRQNVKETLVFLVGGDDEEITGKKIETVIAKAMA